MKQQKVKEQTNDELKSLSDCHFATIEEFEKAMNNPKLKAKYDKMFEEEQEEKTSIKK